MTYITPTLGHHKTNKTFCFCLLAALCCSSSFGFEYNRVPAGLIKGARLSYVSDSTVKIGVGYGETMGSYWEITPTDSLVTTGYTLTGLTTTTDGVFHYIYIDRANSSLPDVEVTNSTTAPAWSGDFMGWYDGANRCIGVVWVQPNGKIVNFICPEDGVYHCSVVKEYPTSGISTTWGVWNTWECASFIPVNATEVAAECSLSGTGTPWEYCTAGVRTGANLGIERFEYGSLSTAVIAWIPFTRGAVREVEWLAFAQSTIGDNFVHIRGYKIER